MAGEQVASGKAVHTVEKHACPVLACVFSIDSKFLISGTDKPRPPSNLAKRAIATRCLHVTQHISMRPCSGWVFTRSLRIRGEHQRRVALFEQRLIPLAFRRIDAGVGAGNGRLDGERGVRRAGARRGGAVHRGERHTGLARYRLHR